MANEKAVENSQPAATEGVENGSNAPGAETKIDWEAEAKQAIAEKAAMTQERDNYKKGLLMAKGKIEDDGTSDKLADEATDISKIVASKKNKPLILTYHNDLIKSGFGKIIANIYNNTLLKSLLIICIIVGAISIVLTNLLICFLGIFFP